MGAGRRTGVSGDSESVAAGVAIPLLCASGAVAWARGFVAAGAPAAPCREVPAPWRALLSGDGTRAAGVLGCSRTRGPTMPLRGLGRAVLITRAGWWPGLKFRLGTR